MTPSARLSAAIEVLAEIEARRRPVADALKDWGLSHRFAGSGDRAAIAGLTYDALRRRASAAWIMGDDAPRAVLLGALRLARGLDPEAIAALCSGERFAPAPLSDGEVAALAAASLEEAPVHVAGDHPEWIGPALACTFGEDVLPELQALAMRAPLDLRVNTLKASCEGVAAALGHLSPAATPHSPWGLRVMPGPDGRPPSIQADPAYLGGEVEIQDEGSQLASLLANARPGETVLDLCAGGGGKTLALAAAMGGTGRLYASDSDPRRLAPIHERLRRAGLADVEVRTRRGGVHPVADLDGRMDLVLVDAPCTGSGTWRRHPDAKWRLRPGSLAVRLKEQVAVLDRAADLVRPGGRIVYVTCSVLPQENDEAVAGLLERRPDLAPVSPLDLLRDAGLEPLADVVRLAEHGLQLSPLRTGTDGFYVAGIRRRE